MSTYLSNHTLERLCYGDLKEIRLMSSYNYCDSNREIRVTQAARLKIIQVHFSGREINMQPFTEMKMELSIRPHAIAWMGRDNSLYQFLRAMPSLLGNGDGKKYIYCIAVDSNSSENSFN
jgi:hypothetical protein